MNASAWEFVRAIRGPILLVTFGTLTALNHTNRLDFERSWPVLIIVYGLLKLVERIVARPAPPPPPPSWHQPSPEYPAPTYTPSQYPPVYPPPQTPQGGAQ
jgi:hypothetical protein